MYSQTENLCIARFSLAMAIPIQTLSRSPVSFENVITALPSFHLLLGMGNPTTEHAWFASRLYPTHKSNDFSA
jgi:hypothetical protein